MDGQLPSHDAVDSRRQTVRSQDLLVSILGRHVLDRNVAVYSGTFVRLLDRCGITEYAARSALTRMVRRGLLVRHRRGRRTYLDLTDRMREVLVEGGHKIYRTRPVQEAWNGLWTLLSFSIPEKRRADRHRLRVRLNWAGFGLLRDGLWIAPGSVDVTRLVDELGLRHHVSVFSSEVAAPTDPAAMVREAWDLDRIARGYERFLERWDADEPLPRMSDGFAREICLITDWRLLLREAPSLPEELLPPDWPATRAAKVFHNHQQALWEEADRIFREELEAIEVAPSA
jgi:phenylacetic acid degradation operon negative regulatory protein